MAEALAKHCAPLDATARRAWLAAQRARARRAPVLSAVVVEPPQAPKVQAVENVQAVAAAMRNLLGGLTTRTATHRTRLTSTW